MNERREIVAVVGGQNISPQLRAQTQELGTLLVDADFRIATGGRGGVMEAALKGGRESKSWLDGRNIAVLPSLQAEDANPYADIVIPTGMNYARNTILVAMADIVIAVGGGAGTLSEIALAWQHNKPIIAMDVNEGWSSRLAGVSLDQRRDDVVHTAKTAKEAVNLAIQLSKTRKSSHGFV